MTETKLHNNIISPTNEEFLDRISPFAEKCPQLQIFLHRERKDNDFSDYEFLMVTPTTFGKVEIKDIFVEEPEIVVEYRDCVVNQIGHFRINVHNDHSKVLFINWHDIKEMVNADLNRIVCDNDLLEFDF